MDCTSGLPITHSAITAVTAKNTTAVASHQRQARYAATGNDTVQNRVNSLDNGAWAPVTAARARATRLERLPTSAESDDAERSIDKCVEARW